MEKKRLLIMAVLALACAVCFADDPTWVPTKHDVVGTWQTGTNWFGDVSPSYAGFQSAIVGNQATINVNSFVDVYELAIGTPWDGGGYNSPTSKKGGTLNIGAGGQVWTHSNFYVAHVGDGTLNVTGGGDIRVGGEFSICKYYGGNGSALLDHVYFNVGSANISTGGTLNLKNTAYLKVWEPNLFNCTGYVNLVDASGYVAIKNNVAPSVYANVIAFGGLGGVYAQYNASEGFTYVSAISPNPTGIPTKHDVVGAWQTGANWFGNVTPSWANYQMAIVGNQATIDANTAVKVYDLAIGTPWDDAGFRSPTAKQGGTLNVSGSGSEVWTTRNFHVAHLGNGTLNVTNGGNIRVGGEFSVSKTSGVGLALLDNVQFNVSKATIGAQGTLNLQNSSYLKVWEPNSFTCTGKVNLYDTTVYVAVKGVVDPSIYAGKIIPLNGAGQLVAAQDGDFTNIFAVEVVCSLEADLTGDCAVDSEDLALLVSEWLWDVNTPIIWEATMDTDPVLSGDWVLRDPAFNHYSISGGKMILDGGNAVIDAFPAMDLNRPVDIWATLRATTTTPSPTYTGAAAPSIWANMDTDQTAHANLRLSIYKISSTEQVLAVISNNATVLGLYGGLGTGMITVHARIEPDGTAGTITLDVTDGVTTYSDQVLSYTNNVPGTTEHRYVTISSLGNAGEIDYIKVETTKTPQYDIAGDPDTINLDDFAVMASEWLMENQ